MEDGPSHLSLVLDLSPTQWHLCSTNDNPISLNTFLAHLLTFLNSHIALKHENTLAVFAALPGKSAMLYTSTDISLVDGAEAADSNTYQPFRTLNGAVMKGMASYMALIDTSEPEAPCALVGALTKALCYINRLNHAPSNNPGHAPDSPKAPDPRILIISVSPDLSTSYISLMNCIFSAQKLKVTIDVCKLFGADTVFLQQAAHLTGGSYLYLVHKDALLQYLLMTFLPPPRLRKVLAVPTQDKVDFRAACFCHKKIVDIGYRVSEHLLPADTCLFHVSDQIPNEDITTPQQFTSARHQWRWPSQKWGHNTSVTDMHERVDLPWQDDCWISVLGEWQDPERCSH